MEEANLIVNDSINLLNTNSEDFVTKLKAEIKEGNIEPIKAAVMIKRMAKIAEEVLKDEDIKRITNDAADQYAEKKIEVYGAQILKMPVHTAYDFSECGDVALEAMYSTRKELDEQIKAKEEELKLLIPKNDKQFSISGDSKDVVVGHVPFIRWEKSDDVITVKAPKKIQKMGLKFMRI